MNAHHPTTRGRKNGLDRPWGYAQIGAWVTYGVSIIQYCVFITPLLAPCITSPILSMLFFTSNLFVFFNASYTILVNPIDIHLHQYRTMNEIQQQQHADNDHNSNGAAAAATNGTTTTNTKKVTKPIIIRNPLHQPPITLMMTPKETSTAHQKISLSDRLYYRANAKQLQLYHRSYHHHCQQQQQCHHSQPHQSQPQELPPLPNEPMKQCWICDASVAEHSMHCKFCNKCVYGFDHHCIWLNTCIGRANYESFFRTLQSLFVMEILHLLSHLILISTFFQDSEELQGRIRHIYPNMSVYVPFAIWIFFIVFNCMALMLLGQLYIFHKMLQVRNLTTYEHIVQDYRNQRSITRRLNDMEAERAESIIRAQSERKTTKVLQLKIGKFCRARGMPYFDIMRVPPEPEEPDPEAGFANIFGKNVSPDPVEVDSEHNNDSSYNNYHENNDADNDDYVNDCGDDDVEMTDYDNLDAIHGGENGNDEDNNNKDENNKSNKHENEGGNNNPSTTYDVDDSVRTNTTRSNRTSNSKSEFHDIMYDGDQQQPPNYVELTMTGQNDYYTGEAEATVVIDDSGDHDGTAVEETNVAGGLDASTSQYYDEDEGEDDDNEEDAVDGLFIDDPDDMSHKSGCSVRSYRSGRSGRSGRSSKSGRTGSKLTERDLTAF